MWRYGGTSENRLCCFDIARLTIDVSILVRVLAENSNHGKSSSSLGYKDAFSLTNWSLISRFLTEVVIKSYSPASSTFI